MIIVKKLRKSYGPLEVLKDLDLEVFDGETVVILGRSGVGKSVLLKQIIGIETPDSGTVLIQGKDINALPRKEREALTMEMGMLFQGGALFDSLTVGENVAFYLRQHHKSMSEKEVQKRVDESLHMVGLEKTQGQMPSDLSGGMKKRAALARVIAYRPRIVLYDEPTTGLDPMTAMQINQLIVEAKQQLQATSIVVTHDLKSALTVGDRLAFHYNKCISHIAPKEEFLKIKDPHIEAFLENASFSLG
jgi:phospholipid/cholesterol/gamma-HCH transport system ATP-binding protein